MDQATVEQLEDRIAERCVVIHHLLTLLPAQVDVRGCPRCTHIASDDCPLQCITPAVAQRPMPG